MRELSKYEIENVDGATGPGGAFINGAGAGGFAGGLFLGPAGAAGGALLGGAIGLALYYL